MHVWPQWLLCSSPWACVLPVAIGWAAGALSLQGRALERVALAKARSELLDRVYALKLRESLTIGDWAAHDLGRDRALRLWLRQTAAYGAARTYSDGSCDVAVRLAPAALEQKLEALSATSGATADGAVATPDFSVAAREWPVLWAQGTAWPTEAELAQQPEGWEDVTPVGLEMTRRAAEADARRALFDSIGMLPVTRARRLSDFLESGEQVREAVIAALQREALLAVSFAPDQVAVATARIGLVDLIRILTEVHENNYQGDGFHGRDFRGMGLLATVDEVSATGWAIPPAAAISRSHYPDGELDAPAWATAKMTASGRYLPRENEKLSQAEQAEAARLDGVDELWQGIQTLALKDGRTLSAFFAEHTELQADLEVFLSGARVVGPQSTQPAGVVTVQIELPLRRLWWIVRRGLRPAEMATAAESAGRPAQKGAP